MVLSPIAAGYGYRNYCQNAGLKGYAYDKMKNVRW